MIQFETSRQIKECRINKGLLENSRFNNNFGSIVAIVPRGETVRNFVHSGSLDQIANLSSLSVLSAVTDRETDLILKERFERIFPLTESRDSWFVRFQRELIDIAHGRWLWSAAAKRRWQIRDHEARSTVQRFKRICKKTLGRIFASPGGLSLLSRAERLSSRILSNSIEYIELFEKLEPTLVFNGSHIHSRNAIQAVQAAQWLGIPTATFIFSWDNLTSQGRIILPYDYFLVWNNELKEQLLEMYDWITPENVFVTGTPQFDFHFRPEFYLSREEFCVSVGADPDRPIVFYATGMPNHMPDEPAIVEGIADILNEFPVSERPQLLVRVYAKDRSGRFDEMKDRRPDIFFPDVDWEPEWLTPKYEDSFALVNTLRHCAVGINVASTVSLELCMFDKPVINVGYNPPGINGSELSYADYYEFDHYKPVVDSGAVRVAWSEAEIRNLIKECLRDPAAGSTGRRNLIYKMFGSTLDGRSANRVADVLTRLAKFHN